MAERYKLWRRVLPGTILLALALITLLAAAGWWDPAPAGPGRALPAVARVVTALPGDDQTIWLDERLPPATAAVALRAGWAGGDQDAAYGLLLGTPAAYLGVALSPLGYATVWRVDPAGETVLLPWRPWPHVRPASAENELLMMYESDGWTIRVNGELLAHVAGGPGPGAEIGLYATAFADPAELSFLGVWLYYR